MSFLQIPILILTIGFILNMTDCSIIQNQQIRVTGTNDICKVHTIRQSINPSIYVMGCASNIGSYNMRGIVVYDIDVHTWTFNQLDFKFLPLHSDYAPWWLQVSDNNRVYITGQKTHYITMDPNNNYQFSAEDPPNPMPIELDDDGKACELVRIEGSNYYLSVSYVVSSNNYIYKILDDDLSVTVGDSRRNVFCIATRLDYPLMVGTGGKNATTDKTDRIILDHTKIGTPGEFVGLIEPFDRTNPEEGIFLGKGEDMYFQTLIVTMRKYMSIGRVNITDSSNIDKLSLSSVGSGIRLKAITQFLNTSIAFLGTTKSIVVYVDIKEWKIVNVTNFDSSNDNVVNSTFIGGTRYSLSPVYNTGIIKGSKVPFIPCIKKGCNACDDFDIVNDCSSCEALAPSSGQYTFSGGECLDCEGVDSGQGGCLAVSVTSSTTPNNNDNIAYETYTAKVKNIDAVNRIFEADIEFKKDLKIDFILQIINDMPSGPIKIMDKNIEQQIYPFKVKFDQKAPYRLKLLFRTDLENIVINSLDYDLKSNFGNQSIDLESLNSNSNSEKTILTNNTVPVILEIGKSSETILDANSSLNLFFVIFLFFLMLLGCCNQCANTSSIFNFFQLIELLGYISLINIDFKCLVIEVSTIILNLIESLSIPSFIFSIKSKDNYLKFFPKYRYRITYSIPIGMLIDNYLLFTAAFLLIIPFKIMINMMPSLKKETKIQKNSFLFFSKLRVYINSFYYCFYYIGFYDFIFYCLLDIISNTSINQSIKKNSSKSSEFLISLMSYYLSILLLTFVLWCQCQEYIFLERLSKIITDYKKGNATLSKKIDIPKTEKNKISKSTKLMEFIIKEFKISEWKINLHVGELSLPHLPKSKSFIYLSRIRTLITIFTVLSFQEYLTFQILIIFTLQSVLMSHLLYLSIRYSIFDLRLLKIKQICIEFTVFLVIFVVGLYHLQKNQDYHRIVRIIDLLVSIIIISAIFVELIGICIDLGYQLIEIISKYVKYLFFGVKDEGNEKDKDGSNLNPFRRQNGQSIRIESLNDISKSISIGKKRGKRLHKSQKSIAKNRSIPNMKGAGNKVSPSSPMKIYSKIKSKKNLKNRKKSQFKSRKRLLDKD